MEALLKSAETGDDFAQYAIGYFYLFDKYSKNVDRAEKWLGRSAEQGNKYAEAHHCGAVFLSGVSVSLWRKSTATVFAVVPAGNLRVIGVFPGAAYTFEVKKSRKFPLICSLYERQ